jgi:hypothetical protein
MDRLTALLGSIDGALARVRIVMHKHPDDPHRFQELLANLVKTRVLCERARGIVSDRLAASLKSGASREVRPGAVSYREYVELSSSGEIAKFRRLSSIAPQDIAACDVDQLLRRLLN